MENFNEYQSKVFFYYYYYTVIDPKDTQIYRTPIYCSIITILHQHHYRRVIVFYYKAIITKGSVTVCMFEQRPLRANAKQDKANKNKMSQTAFKASI